MRIEEIETYEELAEFLAPELIPHPSISRCFVARDDDGKIKGYVFAQPILCVEPIWVAEDERSNGLAVKLFGTMTKTLASEGSASGFMCHADRDEVASYLERLGMKDEGRRVFSYQFRRE